LKKKNARLKRLLAEKELEIQTLTELIKKTSNIEKKRMSAKKYTA